MRRVLAAALQFVLVAALAASHLAAQGNVTYIYDDLGRLIGVVAPNGESAIYSYDAVGNLLSITRQAANVVSVLDFTPNEGSVGAAVTIYGTGFSSTPASNTVSFNGTQATVTSSTTTQIVTSVPANATTGPISVTSPNGSATSAASFIVSASQAPTISGFTPGSGAAGTAVTVNGTNFQTTANTNRLKLNATNAVVSSATATAIQTSVPNGASSGRISVATPAGTAVSSVDFFVPPSPYTPADIETTARMSYGENRNVTINTAGKIGLVLFDGTLGQRVSLKISTGPGNTVSILNPDTSQLASATSSGVFSSFIDTQVLPSTGTYTMVVDLTGSQTGTLTLTLYNVPADVTGPITPGGSAVTLTIGTPGQNARYTFTGTANQRVSLSMTSVSIGSSTVKILKPDGSTLTAATVGIFGGFIDTTTLPSAGTYALTVDPSQADTGNMTLTLYNVPADVSGTITPGGSPVTVQITTPGQNGTLTFSGTADQRISLKISSWSPSGTVTIRNPDNSTLASASMSIVQAFIDTKTLGSTGTYSIVIDPSTSSTGSTTLTLYDVPADITGSLTINGSSVTVTTTTPGQNGSLTFSGTSGQQVTVRLTSNTMGSVTVKLLKPDASVLTSSTSSASSFNLATQTLPTTGTYTVVIDPNDVNVGSITVAVTSP